MPCTIYLHNIYILHPFYDNLKNSGIQSGFLLCNLYDSRVEKRDLLNKPFMDMSVVRQSFYFLSSSLIASHYNHWQINIGDYKTFLDLTTLRYKVHKSNFQACMIYMQIAFWSTKLILTPVWLNMSL